MSEEKNITTRWSRWRVGSAEQAVLEHTFHETQGFPNATERSSLACLFQASERRVQVWFQNQRQRGRYAEDTTTIASLGLNTILLLCIATRLRPDVPYVDMARHVSDALAAAGERADMLVRYHLYTYLVHEARSIRTDGMDNYDAVHVALAGLLTRMAAVLGA